MTRRKLLVLVFGFATTVLVILLFRWPLIGWLRQESFYEGRPTSYWQREIEEGRIWYLEFGKYWGDYRPTRVYVWQRQPGLLDEVRTRLGLAPAPNSFVRPSLLSGDRDAEGVLTELLSASSREVREAAEQGLENIRRRSK